MSEKKNENVFCFKNFDFGNSFWKKLKRKIMNFEKIILVLEVFDGLIEILSSLELFFEFDKPFRNMDMNIKIIKLIVL